MKIRVKTQKRLLRLLDALSVTLALPLQSAVQQPKVQGEKQIWQIGEFDETSREFGRNFEFASDRFKPVFVVGQSKTAEWRCTDRAIEPFARHDVRCAKGPSLLVISMIYSGICGQGKNADTPFATVNPEGMASVVSQLILCNGAPCRG